MGNKKRKFKSKKERLKYFEEHFLHILALDSGLDISHRDNGSYSFYHDTWGQIDLYPKGGKLLIRESSTWVTDGMEWIEQNILSNTVSKENKKPSGDKKKRTDIFDKLDNVLCDYSEGVSTEEDVINIAHKINKYLTRHPHQHDVYE